MIEVVACTESVEVFISLLVLVAVCDSCGCSSVEEYVFGIEYWRKTWIPVLRENDMIEPSEVEVPCQMGRDKESQ